MGTRSRAGAVLGAAAMLLLTASAAFAVPPVTAIAVTKTADPATVPAAGGTVTYTVSIAATGDGFFNSVVVDDGMAGCTLAGPTGDADTDSKLDAGETWAFTCTVDDVMPGTENTATVNACHDNGECGTGDVTGVGSVTVGEDTPDPTQDPGDAEPTEANTATSDLQAPGSTDGAWLLVLALGLLLGSIVVLTPAKAVRRR